MRHLLEHLWGIFKTSEAHLWGIQGKESERHLRGIFQASAIFAALHSCSALAPIFPPIDAPAFAPSLAPTLAPLAAPACAPHARSHALSDIHSRSLAFSTPRSRRYSSDLNAIIQGILKPFDFYSKCAIAQMRIIMHKVAIRSIYSHCMVSKAKSREVACARRSIHGQLFEGKEGQERVPQRR